MMAFRGCQKFIVAALIINLIILLYLAFMQHSENDDALQSKRRSLDGRFVSNKELGQHTHNQITVIIREFEDFEHNIVDTVNNIHTVFPQIDILVIGDKYPYPPLEGVSVPKSLFHYVALKNNMWQNVSSSRPEHFLRTNYVFLIPDSTAFKDDSLLDSLIKSISKLDSTTLLAVPFKQVSTLCSEIKFDYKRWTLEYSSPKENVDCNYITGEHGLFTRTETFLQLSQPFLRPLPLSLYVQGSLKHWTVKIADVSISTLKPLYVSDPHNQWKHKHNQEVRLKHMYKQLGVKLVIQSNGRRQWFGCTKDTERCFDTVINDMPEYLYERRWTPPCCLQALRETMRHVFSILDSCEARYWLEGGSLLGAARHGDIIPWDYDVDIGIYLGDVGKCDYLKQCSQGSYVDDNGFVWEKAREGDWYRVQYSESNRMHVDIFPFFPKNGTMTKNSWIKSHRQDTEFSERFLKPLTKIKFGGMEVKAPNNVKEFLEFKFGPGVIEHPKYPNAKDPL